MAYSEFKSLVTPEEVLQIGKHCKLIHMLTVDKIRNAFIGDAKKQKLREEQPDFYLMLFATYIWNAGRVQGIREERNRRKARQKEGENG